MKIHYISAHAVLEYDEVKLFTELGYDVFSNGAYSYPKGAHTLPRPGIDGLRYYPDLHELASSTPKTDLPGGLIDPFDVIMIMHSPEVLIQNWPKFLAKKKRVILRTIGQNTSGIELKLQKLKAEGLEIVRYSPKERNLANYAGENALIRFYKDPDEFRGWEGNEKEVINFSQSLRGRRDFCHHDEILEIMSGQPGKVYGTGNDDLGELNGGELPYEKMKEKLRHARVMIYGGTWPASYTLSFMEAMMTGIPIVAIGAGLAHYPQYEQFDFYEIPDFIRNAHDGFYSDDIGKLKAAVQVLMNDYEAARKVSKAARERAIELFGKEHIGLQWKEYLG